MIEESKDQIIHLLVGLTLVIKMLPSGVYYQEPGYSISTFTMSSGLSDLKAQAQYTLKKIIDHAHYPSYGWEPGEWDILNPARLVYPIHQTFPQLTVAKGYNLWSFAPAVSELYSRFTGYLNPNLSTWGQISPLSAAFKSSCYIQYIAGQETLFGTIYGGSENGRLNAAMFLSLECMANRLTPLFIKSYQAITHYKHFNLLYAVLNNTIPEDNFSDITQLLSEAPCDGPFKSSPSENWRSSSLLVHPERRYNSDFPGDYNGLDYMLIHNLYLLAFPDGDMKNLYRTTIVDAIPRINPRSLGDGSSNSSYYVPSYTTISANNTISANGSAIYRAGESIDLLPGFNVNYTADFLGYIDSVRCYNKIDLYRENNKYPTSIIKPETPNLNKFQIYPSVADNFLILKDLAFNTISNNKIEIHIYDVSGKEIISQLFPNIELKSIDISNLIPGSFIIEIIGNEDHEIFRFIKI